MRGPTTHCLLPFAVRQRAVPCSEALRNRHHSLSFNLGFGIGAHPPSFSRGHVIPAIAFW